MKKLYSKQPLLVAACLSLIIVALTTAGVTASYSIFQRAPQPAALKAKVAEKAPATIDDKAKLSDTPASAEAIASNPKVPDGMKKIPTPQEEKVMHQCIDRDAAAYAKYYAAHGAEVQRHQTVLAGLKATYDNGGYKFINNPYGPNDDIRYQSDIAAENLIFQQNTAAIYSTYESERSPGMC